MKISQILKENEKEFIDKFCNDHNGEVRFLRSIFWDEKDGAEEILSFLRSSQTKLIEKVIEEVEKILEDEIALAHTTKSGKTSRLTSAYMRIKNLKVIDYLKEGIKI